MLLLQQTLEMMGGETRAVVVSTVERLALAALLGGVIGLERQIRHKAAGLRTNMMICFGSALFTILSEHLAAIFGGDHVRIAAQIIPGIGFIGAGSILRDRGAVVGLTTAATLFVTAGIGMAAGAGLFLTAAFSAAAVLAALVIFGWLESKFFGTPPA
jgi:putative Mg2+ transporter-C (MgtC) family protein